MFAHLPDAATQARLHDLAKAEAVRLRHQAADEFWRGADAVLQRSLKTGKAAVERSAERLKVRLARHVRSRSPSGASSLDSGA